MSEKILCIDDDPNILSAYQRSLRKQFEIDIALGGEEALERIRTQGPYAVIVSDMQMPSMDGIQFLAQAKQIAPDSVRMMLTGNADLRTAIEAMHRGSIFRFLTKPCPPDSLAAALEAGIKQYYLVTAERELLDKTLKGSIKLLMEILSMMDPQLFGLAHKLRRNMRLLAHELKIENTWHIELAALLANIGMVTLPPNLILKVRARQKLMSSEQEMIARLPEISFNLLANIPRLTPVAEIILYQNKSFDGSGFPANSLKGEDIPLGSRMLKVLTDLAQLEFEGTPKHKLFQTLRNREGVYDPQILVAAFNCLIRSQAEKPSLRIPPKAIGVSELVLGHVLLSDIRTSDGLLLISAGHAVTETLLEKIKNLYELGGVKEPLFIERTGSEADQPKAA